MIGSWRTLPSYDDTLMQTDPVVFIFTHVCFIFILFFGPDVCGCLCDFSQFDFYALLIYVWLSYGELHLGGRLGEFRAFFVALFTFLVS